MTPDWEIAVRIVGAVVGAYIGTRIAFWAWDRGWL